MTSICIAHAEPLGQTRGGTVRVVSLAAGLAGAGYDVHLVAPTPGGEDSRDPPESVTFHPVDVPAAGALDQLPRAALVARRARRVAREHDAVLQIERATVAGVATLLGCSDYVVDLHDVGFDGPFYRSLPLSPLVRRFVYRMERRGVRRADRVISVSDPMAEFVRSEWGVAAADSYVVHNGVRRSVLERGAAFGAESPDAHADGGDPAASPDGGDVGGGPPGGDESDPSGGSGTRGDTPDGNGTDPPGGPASESRHSAAFLGSVNYNVDYGKLLRLARELDVVVHVVGDGPERSDLQRRATRAGLDVVVHGYLPDEAAYGVLRDATVCVFPIRDTHHTSVAQHMKGFDYGALGKAIATDRDGTAAILEAEDAALVSDPAHPGEFVENVDRLLSDPGLRRRLGRNARAVAERFTWESRTRDLIEALEGAPRAGDRSGPRRSPGRG